MALDILHQVGKLGKNPSLHMGGEGGKIRCNNTGGVQQRNGETVAGKIA